MSLYGVVLQGDCKGGVEMINLLKAHKDKVSLLLLVHSNADLHCNWQSSSGNHLLHGASILVLQWQCLVGVVKEFYDLYIKKQVQRSGLVADVAGISGGHAPVWAGKDFITSVGGRGRR